MGAASVNSAGNQVSVIVGGGSGNNAVTINGLNALSAFGSSATVTLEYVASSGRTSPSAGTSVVSTSNYPISNGSITVPINAMDSTGAYHLLITPSGTPTPTPTAGSGGGSNYEGESSANTLAGGAVVAACSACSGGLKVGYVGLGGTLQFNNIQASSAGTYALTISYVDGDAGRTAQMSVNGATATTITFHGTNDVNWNFVQSLTVSVPLNAGNNTILFSNPSASAPDFDRITVAPTTNPGSTPTPKPTNTPAPTPTTTTGSSCKISYAILNQWPGGFTGSIVITNAGSTTINGWSMQFTFASGQQITQGWDAAWSQSGANVTAQNLSYNSTIAANSSLSMGFNASWTGSNPNPTSFTLNGSSCTS